MSLEIKKTNFFCHMDKNQIFIEKKMKLEIGIQNEKQRLSLQNIIFKMLMNILAS